MTRWHINKLADDGQPQPHGGTPRVVLGERSMLLRGFACERVPDLFAAIGEIAAVSPFRHMATPGGWEMSVAVTKGVEKFWSVKRPTGDQALV